MSKNRKCGMLLPISSLSSNYGIGSFSKEAYEFVDLLKRAGQSYWQILPLGPTGYGDSPYQSFSAFAGNPYFIDLDTLIQEGLLTQEECGTSDFGTSAVEIDYERIYKSRFPLLNRAYKRWKEKYPQENPAQLLGEETREYCFYMAVKNYFQEKSWIEWDEDIRLRKPEAVSRYEMLLKDEIEFYQFQQMKFEEQWKKLKAYAHSSSIQIIGDIPIYVAFDSADSWAHPELFQFNEENRPTAVAGCPPDGFSATGQLWGNPLYRWEYHEEHGYEWWMERMRYSFQLYDVLRVDHFRGFDEYYSIPAENTTAEGGHWRKGPGISFFKHLETLFGNLNIIAEDLGFVTPTVAELLSKTGYPGMKVIEFAFDSREESDYLPHNYSTNSVVYTGTHDNDTIRGWYEALVKEDKQLSLEYMGNEFTPLKDIHWDFIRMALASVADLAVIPVQDYLGLGSEERINTPSTLGQNWKWRLCPGQIGENVVEKCRKLSGIYGRL